MKRRNFCSNDRRRGSTTLEAIMVMTLMLLLWAGVTHLGKAYVLTVSSKSQARGCAWQVSASNCKNIPERCDVTLGNGKSHDGEDKLERQAEAATSESFMAKLCRVALIDQITSLFSKRAQATVGSEIHEPTLLGGKEVRVAGHYSLPCNSRGQDTGDQEADMKKNAISHLTSGAK